MVSKERPYIESKINCAPVYLSLSNLRWGWAEVHIPTNFLGGPGATKRVRQLQQAWTDQYNNLVWRPIPEVEE